MAAEVDHSRMTFSLTKELAYKVVSLIFLLKREFI
jgi:hypothetical protein